MPTLVPLRKKQEAVKSIVKSAANQNTSGITVNLHHRLASEYDAVSRRQRREVFGDPFYYAEVLPGPIETAQEAPNGEARSVRHTFRLWLIYEWSDADPYAGSSQETFNDVISGYSPRGVLPALREEGYRDIGGDTVVVGDPESSESDIIPLGQSGGGVDSAHVLRAQIPVQEPTST